METPGYVVKRYKDLGNFEAGINKMLDESYVLDSWQECGVEDTWYVIAVFGHRERKLSMAGPTIPLDTE